MIFQAVPRRRGGSAPPAPLVHAMGMPPIRVPMPPPFLHMFCPTHGNFDESILGLHLFETTLVADFFLTMVFRG